MDTDLYRTIEVRDVVGGWRLRAWKEPDPAVGDAPDRSISDCVPFFDTVAASHLDQDVEGYAVFEGRFRLIETPGHVLVIDASDDE